MDPAPVPGSGPDEDPGHLPSKPAGDGRLPPGTDWTNEDLWEAYLASRSGEQEPDDPELEQDPDHSPPPGLDSGRS